MAAGHPDKICDAIADGIVGLAMARNPRALVGVEVAVHRGMVFVTGRAAGAGLRLGDVEAIVRGRYASLGLGGAWPPDPEGLGIVCDLDTGPLLPGEADFREVSDDQAICTGYAAASPSTGWLPPEHWLVHRIVRGLEGLRAARPELRLGPDAKAAVLCEERPANDGAGWRAPAAMTLWASTVSLQQAIGANEIATRRAVVEVVEAALAAAPSVFARPGGSCRTGAGQRGRQLRMRRNAWATTACRARSSWPTPMVRAWRSAVGPGRARTGSRWIGRVASSPAASRWLPFGRVQRERRPSSCCGNRATAGRGVVALAGDDGALLDPAPFTSGIPLTLRDSGNRWPAALAADRDRLGGGDAAARGGGPLRRGPALGAPVTLAAARPLLRPR